MRVFRTKAFSRFARKSRLTDAMLCRAIRDAERGLVDADLGGGVIKQRIACSGGGKSGGFRTIVLLRRGSRAFFVYGFAKNEMDNIDDGDLADFIKLAGRMLAFNDAELEAALRAGVYTEIEYDDHAVS